MTPRSDSSAVTIAAQNPNAEAAIRLIHDLCSELTKRYGTPPSSFSPADTLAPRAAFLVAQSGPDAIGCGALRRIDDHTAEVKRMYVVPSYRRKGIARRILSELERLAVGFEYWAIRLETGLEQPESIRLYESSGYHRIPTYGEFVGDPASICFEKILNE